MAAHARPVVIGLGNEHRRDDACGLSVVRALQAQAGLAARVVEGGDDASGLLDLWDGGGPVYVVDALSSGRPPGTVLRLEVGAAETPLPTPPTTSTHGLSLADAVGLGRALGRLPDRLVVFGIEVDDVTPGEGLTPPVAAGVLEVTQRLVRELGERGSGPNA